MFLNWAAAALFGFFGALAASAAALAQTPQLTLIGTVLGKHERFALFLMEKTGGMVLLKPGEGHAGWVLCQIASQEVALEKDGEAVRLSLQAGASLSSRASLQNGQRVPTAFKAPPNQRPAGSASLYR